MEFLEALSPTLLILVIIKHSQLNTFQTPEKTQIVYEKHF